MLAYECSAHLGLTGSHKLRTLYLLLLIEDHQQVRVDIQVDFQVVATLQHQVKVGWIARWSSYSNTR